MKLNKDLFVTITHAFILGMAKVVITVYFLVLRVVKNLTCWVKKQIMLHKMMKTLKPYLLKQSDCGSI